MPFFHLADLPTRTPVDGFTACFVHSEKMTHAYWTIKQGASLPGHAHPHEQVATILEGSLELTVGGQAHVMNPGDVAVIPSGVEHSARAVTDCRVLDVFSPVREDFK